MRRQGEAQSLSDHDTKDDAVAAGRDSAERDGVELVIKNLDGRIGEKDSHGHDPRNIPG